MKVYVIPAGEGLVLPLPAHLAAALGLGAGSAVEIRGPAPDGALRYVPIDGGEVEDSEPTAVASRIEPGPESSETVAPADVATAVSSAPRGMSIPPAPAATTAGRTVDPGEISQLIELHADAIREVCE